MSSVKNAGNGSADNSVVYLRTEFTLNCYDCEEVNDDTRCYHIGLAVNGIGIESGGSHHVIHPLIEGYATVNETRFWFEERRPVEYPVGMTEAEAIVVLSVIFESMDRGAIYDGDLAWKPINLKEWLGERLNIVLADHVERVLHAAVAVNNGPVAN